MSGPAGSRDHQPRGIRAQSHDPIRRNARSPERAKESCAFLLTKTYMDGDHPTRAPFTQPTSPSAARWRDRESPVTLYSTRPYLLLKQCPGLVNRDMGTTQPQV